jgi:galactokinase
MAFFCRFGLRARGILGTPGIVSTQAQSGCGSDREGRTGKHATVRIMNKASLVLKRFKAHFGQEGVVYRAPGRVNLIGEHTDYNEGFVLPAAIDSYCWVAAGPRSDGRIALYSENLQRGTEVELHDLWPRGDANWTDYPLGVAWALQEAGHRLRGANVYISGELPLGGGLSSSAAIEVAVGYALQNLSQNGIDRRALALICQHAENAFVGARCGIMDQFVACNGRTGHALLIDCRSLEWRALRLPPEIRLVVCNTMVKHEHSGGEYNLRRSECEEGVRRLAVVLPGLRSLRDLSHEQLEVNRKLITDVVYRRCRHVILENDRVLRTAEGLECGDIRAIARLMSESHRSLRDDFEVSCPELDLMVEIASAMPGVHGARMTGGGFGGSTLNLVAASEAEGFREHVAVAYESKTGLRPEILICEASQGVEAVDPKTDEIQSTLLH